MKLKYPKKVEIGGYNFKVLYRKEEYGASFNFTTREIIVGTIQKDVGIEAIFFNITHEIMEIVHCIIGTRYDDSSVENNFKFFMDHKEFENSMIMFSTAIKQFIE